MVRKDFRLEWTKLNKQMKRATKTDIEYENLGVIYSNNKCRKHVVRSTTTECIKIIERGNQRGNFETRIQVEHSQLLDW